MHIQFFSPASNVWAHSFPESLVMDYLSKKGHTTSRVSCDGVFKSSCPAFNELGVNNDKDNDAKIAICRSCRKRRDLLEKQFEYSSINLDDSVNSTIINNVERLIEDVTTTNWMDFTVNDIPFGKLASYEFCLHHKDVNYLISNEHFEEYMNYLRTTLISHIGGIEVLKRTKPDAVVFYNSLYSINAGYEQAAKQLGIATYSVQGGPHLVDKSKTLTLFSSIMDLFLMPYSSNWQSYSSIPLSMHKVDEVNRHLFALLKGSSPWAYSAPVGSNTTDKFPTKSILVLTSSEDELAAGRLVGAFPKLPIGEGFPSQTHWLNAIVEIARKLDHINFIIRVHPRMAPNKRDSKTAPFIDVINQLVDNSPSNVFLNLPDDEISLYELINNTSMALNYSSSAGIELLCFGVTVINAVSQDFLVAPMDISLNARNNFELESQILKTYGQNAELKFAVNAYRWFSFQFNRSARFVFENSNPTFSQIRPKQSGIRLRLWNTMVRLVVTRLPTILEKRQFKATRSDAMELADFETVLVNKLSGLHELNRVSINPEKDDLQIIIESIKNIRERIGTN